MEISAEVALNHFNSYQSLDLLRDCELQVDSQGPSWVPDWSRTSTRPLEGLHTRASSQLTAWREVPKTGVLRVVGVSCTSILSLKQIPMLRDRSYRECIDRIHEALSSFADLSRFKDEDHLVEDYARCLSGGNFLGTIDPPLWSHISLIDAKDVVKRLQQDPSRFSALRGSVDDKFVRLAAAMIEGTKLILCEDNHLGIAPPSARVGDKVCLIVGCDSLLVLRPSDQDDGTHILVGSCSVSAFSKGEALYGPLPRDVRQILTYNETLNQAYFVYVDESTGTTSHEDPRLQQLPVDLTAFRECLEQCPKTLLNVDVSTLKDIQRVDGKKVDVRTFDLV